MEAPALDLPVKPRRWWVALGLSLFSPSAAYLYVGRPRRALAIALFWFAVFLSFRQGLGGVLAQPAAWVAMIGLCLATTLFAIVDASRIAAGEPRYRLRKWNQFWIYVVVVAAVGLVNAAVIDPRLGGFLAARSFSIPSGSMMPTLEVGDYAIADMLAYERGDPVPGDVVLLDKVGDRKTIWVKRIVAGPGDRIALVDGKVVVNGKPADQTRIEPAQPPLARETLADGRGYVIAPDVAGPEALNQMEERTVPAGAYFVLGDNRGNSLDSRDPTFGVVQRANILGQMQFIYWSNDRTRIGARVQ
jgi:signal peptidase I